MNKKYHLIQYEYDKSRYIIYGDKNHRHDADIIKRLDHWCANHGKTMAFQFATIIASSDSLDEIMLELL